MNIVEEKLNKIRESFERELLNIKSKEDVDLLEVKYLGRKNELNEVLKSIKDLPVEERAASGQLANSLRREISEKFDALKLSFNAQNETSEIDVTMPGSDYELGHLHIVTQAIKEITEIFQRIGFYRVRYPEIDWDWYAFGSLNFPDDHPARDDWETFYVDPEERSKPKLGRRVFTPHTSNGQVREMENRKPPIRMINISKTGRRQITSRHTPIFHQFEGLMIDEGINISHLKGVLEYFVKEFFDKDRVVRIRPYNFRFTEPSFEVDVSCGNCGGKGCKVCKDGWLEIGGAGMVHPKVLENGGIDPNIYSGFAFGWGVERNAIMKKGKKIDDIRMLYQNDIRFLEQF